MLKTAALGLAACLACDHARGQNTGVATGVATIQPAGARTGTNGVNNFNVEGTANGTNGSLASFGVLDFSASGFNLGAQSVTGVQGGALSLTLTESDAAFTLPGSLQFYLTTNYSTSISNVAPASPLRFQSATATGTNDPPWGIDPLLGSLAGNGNGTLFSLGTGTFTTTGNTASGQHDTYSLTLSNTAIQAFVAELNASGGAVRLVVAATTTTTAATYYGLGTTATANRPSLSFTPVYSTANNLYWQGNSGTWSASGNATFNPTSPGAGGSQWNNDGSHVAVFAGTPGTVAVDAGINAAGLQFDATGYTLNPLASGNTLNLSGASSFIQVTNATDTATINVALGGGTGFNKTGAGTLVLGGANTYTGTTTISAGTLQISADSNLGNAANTVTLNGGTLQSGLTSGTLTIARGIGGSGGLGVAGGTTLAISGVVNAGTLTLPGAGSVILTNTSAASTMTGLAFQTAGGSVQAQNAGQIGGFGTVNLGTGGITASQSTGNVSAGGIFLPSGTTVPMAVANAGASLTVNGYFFGASTIVKTGAGTLVMNSDNSNLAGAGTGTASFRQGSVGTASGGVVSIPTSNPNPNYALGTGEFQANGGTISNDSGAAIVLAIADISLGARDATATPGGLVFAGSAGITVSGPISLYKGATNAYQHQITVNTPTTFTGVLTASANTTTSLGLTIGGSSTLTLNGTAPNTMAEPVTIATTGTNAGVVAAAEGAFAATTAITLNAGARLTIATGVLTGTTNAVNDAALLSVNGTAGTPGSFGKIVFALGTGAQETVGGLYLSVSDGTLPAGFQAPGTYGATGSGAQHIDNALFSGAGVINNMGTAVPEPSTWAALLAGLLGLGAAARRGRSRCRA